MFFCSGNFQLPRIFFHVVVYLFGNDQEIWSDKKRAVKVEISPLVYDIESVVFTT